MSSIKTFNTKPYRGFSKLEIGKYEIKRFNLVNNRFATEPPFKSLLVELEDQVSKLFMLFIFFQLFF